MLSCRLSFVQIFLDIDVVEKLAQQMIKDYMMSGLLSDYMKPICPKQWYLQAK
jgi:hypothetical protein